MGDTLVQQESGQVRGEEQGPLCRRCCEWRHAQDERRREEVEQWISQEHQQIPAQTGPPLDKAAEVRANTRTSTFGRSDHNCCQCWAGVDAQKEEQDRWPLRDGKRHEMEAVLREQQGELDPPEAGEGQDKKRDEWMADDESSEW